MGFSLTSPESLGLSSERLARIRPVMQSYIDKLGFPGFNILLARHGKIVHFEQIGHQDPDQGVALAPDTIYRIYSMTKALTAVTLMTLYEEGRFQLYDPLSKYLPEFANPKVLQDGKLVDAERPILVRDVLTHSAGFSYDFNEDDVAAMYREAGLMSRVDRSLAEVVDELAKMPLAYQPFTRYYYSVATDVAARLAEVLADKPWRELMLERLIKPLGLEDTDFYVPAEKRNRVSAMYGLPEIWLSPYSVALQRWNEGYNQRQELEEWYPTEFNANFARGGHGLFSTTYDYFRFAQMIANGGELDGARILSRKTIDFMYTNHFPASMLPIVSNGIPIEGLGVGLGSNMALDINATKVMGSNGTIYSGGAAKTQCWVDRQEGLVGLMMTQYLRCPHLPDKDFQVLAYQALID
jgi:CubicO group peptidase (beta-lactamase class C family)